MIIHFLVINVLILRLEETVSRRTCDFSLFYLLVFTTTTSSPCFSFPFLFYIRYLSFSKCNAPEIGAAFPRESEQPQYGPTQLCLCFLCAALVGGFFSCVRCFGVFIPPAVRPTLLRQIDMEYLTCAQIWVRAVHSKGGGAQLSLQKS